MAQKRDYYEVLGVARDADARSIKSSYRKLAMKNHPDRNPGDPSAEDRFKEAAEAYEVLSDDNKRAIYDRAGFDGLRSGGYNPGFQDFGDVFSHFGDIFAELFGGASGFGGFGGGGGGRPRPMVGADLNLEVEVTLEEVLSGTERSLEIVRQAHCDDCEGTGAKGGEMQTCAVCGGRGQVVQGRGGFVIATTCRACGGSGQSAAEACDTCAGRGHRDEDKTIEVKIPPGVRTGTRMRVPGAGDVGLYGGPPGDLYTYIAVQPHNLFVREEDNLHCELAVSFSMACLGGETLVPKLGGGETTVVVPEAMQPGDSVRVQGEGLPKLMQKGGGDLVVHLTVRVPSSIDSKQRELIEKLDDAIPLDPEFSSGSNKRRETRKKKKGGGFFDRLKDALDGD